MLRSQYKKDGEEEEEGDYSLRLGLVEIALKDALFVAFGRAKSRDIDLYKDHLEFQSTEVQDRIAILRSRYPSSL